MTCPRCDDTKIIDQWGHPCPDCQPPKDGVCTACQGTALIDLGRGFLVICRACQAKRHLRLAEILRPRDVP